MAIQIGDNFLYRGRKPLDSRLSYNTITDMKNAIETTIYDGIIAFNKETSKFYTYLSSNSIDTVLGKWRELELGGTSLVAYEANTEYRKDTLVYLDVNLTRVTADYTSGTPVSPSTLQSQFEDDITANKLTILGGDNIEIGSEKITFDGSTKKFNLINDYKNAKQIDVYINGLKQNKDDYIVDASVIPDTIEFTDIYDAFDECIIEYLK